MAAGVSISSNNAVSTIDYSSGTTFERLIAVQIQLNGGNTGEAAMIGFLTDPGGGEREFMHINTSNQIEFDTEPQSQSASHSLVDDGTGAVVIDDGAWILFELAPVTGTNWRVVPVVLLADGTRIQGNDIDVDLNGISSESLGISRSTAQRGQVLQYKTIQIPGYLFHSALTQRFDHLNDKWCFGFARLIEGTTENVLNVVAEVKGPITDTGFSRDISGTAIGGTGNSVLTLPADYTDFEMVHYVVIEDGGQTTSHHFMTRELEANASISPHRISGNDTATWNRAARTMTLDSTSDTWTQALLSVPRLS